MSEVGGGDGAELLGVVGGSSFASSIGGWRRWCRRRPGPQAYVRSASRPSRPQDRPAISPEGAGRIRRFWPPVRQGAEVPRFPIFVGKAEEVLSREDANHVDAEGAQRGRRPSLPASGRARDLHREPREAEVLTQGGHHLTWTPVTAVLPKSIGMRSGGSCRRAAATREAEVMAIFSTAFRSPQGSYPWFRA